MIAQNNFHKGLRFQQEAQFDSAARYLHRARSDFRKARAAEEELRALQALALHHLEYSAFDSCRYYLELANAAFAAKPGIADSLALHTTLLRGRYHLVLDQFAQADPLLEKVHLQSRLLSPTFQGQAHLYLGFLKIRQAEFDKAKELLDEALTRSAGDSVLRGEVLAVLGIYHQEKRDWKQALARYQGAAALLERHLGAEHPKLAMAYVRMGLCEQVLGKRDRAGERYQKALHIQQNRLPKDHLDRVLVYGYLGILNGLQGDHGQALNFFQQALRIASKHMGERHRLVASNHNNIGNALIRLERYEEAAAHIQQAASLFSEIFGPEHVRVGSAYNSLGLSYKYLGQFGKALASYQKALEIRKKRYGSGHASLAEIYNNTGTCYEALGQFEQALVYYQQAVAIGLETRNAYDGNLARYHNNVAKCYRGLRDYEQALQWHQKALGRLAGGFSELEPQANPDLQAIVDKRVMLEVLSNKAFSLAEYAVEKPEFLLPALRTYQLAGELIDDMRLHFLHEDSKYQMAATSLGVYEGAIGCAHRLYQQSRDLKWMEYAFQMSEKNKAILLLQSLKDAQARQFGQIPDTLLSLEQNLSRGITALEEKIFKARYNTDETAAAQIESWENELFAYRQRRDSLTQAFEFRFPDYYRLKYETKASSLDQVIQDLPDGETALIEYFVGVRQLGIFYLSGQQRAWTLMPLDSSLHEEVRAFRQLIAQPMRIAGRQKAAYDSSLAAIANQLYHNLIEPVYALQSDTAQALIIVPDGVLGYLPFDALLTDFPRQPGQYKSYPYLMHRHQISYAYSAAIWQEMLSLHRQAKKEVLALAPVFEQASASDPLRNGFGPLAYNQQEARAIHQLLGGRLILAEEATEANFRRHASTYQLIHISSHARINDLNPLFSQIAFSSPRDSLSDGVITLAELFDLKLSANMIVLSACETGIGKLYRGEGIASQARGFAYAGARSIVTTLWSVNDAATAEIMPLFYEELQEAKTKDLALRDAKRRYLTQTDNLGAHPFYWAGVVAIGNMAPLDLDANNKLIWGLLLSGVLVLGGLFFWFRKQ
jgi:CHAT domain-containing protein/Tfp pilus assembly protein PilF